MSSRSEKIAVVASALSSDIRAAAKLARTLGFRGIQLDAVNSQLDLTTLSITGQREIRQIIRSCDLEPASLRIDLGPKGLGPAADVDAALAELEAALAAARGLQVGLVCVEIGPLPSPAAEAKAASAVDSEYSGLIFIPHASRNPKPAVKSSDAPEKFDSAFAASVDGALAELGRRADRHGVMLGFRSDLAGFAALDRALRAAACTWFGIDLDPVAILRDSWPADEIFSRLGNSIRHVRARDAVAGADRRTMPASIGAGSVQWQSILSMLDEAGFKGWMTVDPMELSDRSAGANLGAKFLHNQI
jgi:sugar phosphate isomerase/epimerase